MTSSNVTPLAGVRVIDTTDDRGALCPRLLADLGAVVLKVEPTGGSPARRLPPLAPDGTSYAFAIRNTNKLSVTLDLDEPAGLERFHELLAGADVWIDGHAATELDALGIDPAQVAERHRHLVAVSITDFGLTGPYRNFVATDDVMVAVSGMLSRSGVVGRPPLLPPGTLASDVTSHTAAFFVLAALWQRRATGHGQHLDVSINQAVSQITDWSMANYTQVSAAGGVYDMVRNGSGNVYPLYPCADGYVRLIILSPRQWRAMREWLGDPEILQNDHWDSLLARISIQHDILTPIFNEFFANFTAAELADEAQRRGVVMTPVVTPSQVTKLTHFVERGTFVDAQATSAVSGPVASGYFEIDGTRAGYRCRAPEAGEHDLAELAVDPQPAPTTDRPPASLPFAGLKVLDLGHGGVGVETGRMFAEYGADVIKVETHTYPDFIRQLSGGMMSPAFASSSRTKRSVAINAKTPGGLAALKRLIAWADVMIENTSTGTMDDLGIPYEVVREINPRVVMASSQLMGSTGLWKDWLGYGPSTRPAGGMTYLWNFADGGTPPGSAAIHPDHLVGRTLAFGALAMLLARESDPTESGRGAHVEAPQVESLINMLADYFLAEGVEPGTVGPEGNRRARGAPWGVYQCAGDERWCVITIRDDADWRAFRRALDDPAWASADEYATVEGRRAAHDEIDAHISEWTAGLRDDDVMKLLQAAGVPAGAMAYPSDLATNEHSVARGYPRPVEQPPIGPLLLDGPAFASSAMIGPIITAAPLLAEHTRAVCAEVLGMTDVEIDVLVAEGALELPRS
ncbi:MAG TPA: CoA transferase [Ilumatobacter sp.]|nr:CoA transferase [Ilumatobacter sp.]